MTLGEILRKSIHITAGALALLLPFLTRWQALVICLLAAASNGLFLPRLTRHALERDEDRRRGFAAGIIYYPLSIGALLIFFGGRMEVVAAAWGILAFGDGFATLAGRRIGGPTLAWNAGKTWSGLAAFAVAGATGAMLLMTWFFRHAPDAAAPPGLAIIAWSCGAAALVAAFIESYPSGMNDNITVPLSAGCLLFGLSFVDASLLADRAGGLARDAAIAVSVNLIVAATARAAGTVSNSGAIAGVVVGTSIWTFGGFGAWGVLIAFFVLASGATKFGYAGKAQRRLAQEAGGRRGARHAIANGGVAVVLSFLAAATGIGDAMRLALVAALATAAFDTLSSELGQVWGRRAFLITTLRRVPPGTEGAVSVEGTLAGATGATLLALLAWSAGLAGIPGAAIIVLAATVGATFESFLGAIGRGSPPGEGFDNEAMNFINTLVGAATALALSLLTGL